MLSTLKKLKAVLVCGHTDDQETKGEREIKTTGDGSPDVTGSQKSGVSSSEDNALVDVPVLIVGGGPTGLFLAYLLAKLGIKSLIIEKYPERLAAPKAHALSPRTLEICRQSGLDTKAIRALGSQRSDAYWVNFVTNLSGEKIGVLPYERMDPKVLFDTPEMIHNIPQPRFEQFVADELQNESTVEIRKGVSFISCVQKADEVFSIVEERGTKKKFTVRSKHVVGCDGAKSAVKRHLKIDSEGEDSYQTMMTIHFHADLRPIVGDRVGMLHWILDPMVSGFIIAYDLSGNQVLISNFDGEKHPLHTWDIEYCNEVLTAAIGKEIPFKVQSFRPWVLSRKVANKYHVGNVFLAGDAAHAFPPTGGLGLNCGIADVHNLAYKLAAVHQGWGGRNLLQSYGAERRFVAEVCSTQSVKNGKEIFSFLKALGTAGIEDPDEARVKLYESIHDPNKQELIERKIEGQREHFDNLELHIGYVYGATEKPPHASHYSPKFYPGARLPHAWIRSRTSDPITSLKPIDITYVHEIKPWDREAYQYSILDLCAYDTFTFLVGCRITWIRRFEALQKVPKLRNVKLALFAADTDFEFASKDHEKLFMREAEWTLGAGLLVRPDQHILLRLTRGTVLYDLKNALIDHLGL